MKFGKAFILFLLLAIVVWWGVCRPCSVPMGGMEPALYKDDKVLLLNKWCDRELRTGDMVLYDAFIADSSDKRIGYKEQVIARIAACPGDMISLNSDNMLLDSTGTVIPYSRDFYVYSSKYDDRVMQIIDRRNWGVSELVGYEGTDFVRPFTASEAYFLSKAIPEDLDLRQLRCDTSYTILNVMIPQKGKFVEVTENNMNLLLDALVRYEKCSAEIRDNRLYVNGKRAKRIIFTKDYYWMKSENVMDVYDSRMLGFVPYDEIKGRLAVVFFSRDNDGKIRWNRLFDKVK